MPLTNGNPKTRESGTGIRNLESQMSLKSRIQILESTKQRKQVIQILENKRPSKKDSNLTLFETKIPRLLKFMQPSFVVRAMIMRM